jgi:penicillin-binding protein 1B
LDVNQSTTAVRFYARPLVLNVAEHVEMDRVERHLERMGYRRVRDRTRVGPGAYYRSSGQWVIGRRSFRHFDRYQAAETVTIRIGWDDRIWNLQNDSGERTARFVLEPELIHTALGDHRKDKIPVPLSAVPKHMVDAVLTIEDQRFYDHGGMDIRRVVGAGIANFKAGKVVQGGSTLTQQLAKNLFLSARRTPIRKYRELLMAFVLEVRYSKDEILQAYLNEVYMGQHHGVAVHGVARGAQLYFGKDISEVEVSEAAVLAGIIRGPNLYSPDRNPALTLARRNLVLDLMRERDVLREEEYEVARAAALNAQEVTVRSGYGRYFVDHVSRQLRDVESLPQVHGLSIFTTLDLDLQVIAEAAVREGLSSLEKVYPPARREESPLQAALVALNPETGEILAMVGGRDYAASQFNRAVDARRQPGSAFKPVVALAALSRREGYTLASVVEDAPLSVETPAGMWEPSNYDGQFRGPVTLRSALERSLNVPFARIGLDIGPEHIAQTATRLGLDGHINPVPSLALGASEVTPLGLTRAFGVLAARGFRADLNSVLAVVDGHGNLVSRSAPAGEQVYLPEEVYLVTSALRGAVDRGTGRGLRRDGFRGDVAGKSGTTNDFRDAWFVGFTPRLALGVWVGFDDGRSIGLPGSRAALPIFSRFLAQAVGSDGDGEFEQPSGLEVAAVGDGPGWGCRGEPELFLPGTVPMSSCSSWYSNFFRSSRRSMRNSQASSILEELRQRQRRSRSRRR